MTAPTSETSAAGEAVGVATASETSLRDTIAHLAAIERGATSPGEAEAADWIANRLRPITSSVRIDHEPVRDSYAPICTAWSAVGVLAGVLSFVGARRTAISLGAVAAAGLADECANGPRVLRGLLGPNGTTTNVVAVAGDPSATRTVIVLAHHDAAPTGAIFDPSLQQWAGRRFPELIERIDTSLPVWWPVVGGPALVAAATLLRNNALLALGTATSLGSVAAFADITRSPIVPGANDNLSAVASLVAIAEALTQRPVTGVRVMLVSCGAEETLQEGMRRFAARHLEALDRDSTWVINLDTVGSPRLVMLEGEGPIVMEDYPRPEFRDLVAAAAERAGIHLRRGMRARASTDSVIAARMGFATTTLVSIDSDKTLSNYHLMTDTADRVDYGTVARAAATVECVIRELAD